MFEEPFAEIFIESAIFALCINRSKKQILKAKWSALCTAKPTNVERITDMTNVSILYWSGTGNTEAMAKLIEQGASSAGAHCVRKTVDQASPDDVTGVDVCALGCPSMGDETLEDSEFEPFIESVRDKIAGKKVALFGSYGWGNGEWMREWEQRMKEAGAQLVGSGLIVQETPEGEEAEKCRQFGSQIVH